MLWDCRPSSRRCFLPAPASASTSTKIITIMEMFFFFSLEMFVVGTNWTFSVDKLEGKWIRLRKEHTYIRHPTMSDLKLEKRTEPQTTEERKTTTTTTITTTKSMDGKMKRDFFSSQDNTFTNCFSNKRSFSVFSYFGLKCKHLYECNRKVDGIEKK